MAVRALAPERGFVRGGLRVAVHGAGFTDALACQFGPRVVAPASINEQGTRMLCVAPPFAHALGGFVRVGVAIRVGGGGAAVAAASAPRGALTFAYEAPPRPTSVAPRAIDAAGGDILWITGVDAHVASACAFEPHPRSVAEKRFVSSALGACETPARTPGETVVFLVARTDRGDGDADGDADGDGRVLGWDDGGVAGLAVVAYRPGDEARERARAGAGADDVSSARESDRAAALRAAADSADETSPANAPTPVAFAVVPWEGPAAGGSPAFVAGADLSPGAAGAPAFCAFRFGAPRAAEAETGDEKTFSGFATFAVPGVVVSSALIACERPPAPAWAGALAARVEVGWPVLGWSASGTAAFAPRGGAAVTRVAPRRLPAEGGAETSVFGVFGGRFANARGLVSVSCRFGTIGPVSGFASGAEETRCVSPAMAPRRGVRVYGPDPEASGSFFGTGAGMTVRIAEDAAIESVDGTNDSTTTSDFERRRAEPPTRVAAAAALARADALASALAAGAAVTRVRSPDSVPAEHGALVTLEGVFPPASGAYLEAFGTAITCRFGSVAVLGRRVDGASAECAAPSAAPGAKRVAVDGAAGAVALEHVSRSSRLASSSPNAATSFFFDREDEASFRTARAPEVSDVRLAHYAGGSDVFAGTLGFVQFALSETFGASASSSLPAAAAWCAFDDGAATRARFVSSVVGTCDAPIRSAAGARDASGGASPERGRRARTSAVAKRFALETTLRDETRARVSNSASFALRVDPPVVTGAAPSVVAADGGETVTVFGDGLFDRRGEGAPSGAPSLAWCRFGSLGPVLGRRDDDDDGFAGALACVAPARAPSHRRAGGAFRGGGVPVTAFDAFHWSAARVAFRDAPTSPFAVPSAVVGDAAGGGSSTVTVYFAGQRAPFLVAARPGRFSGPAFDVVELVGSIEKGASARGSVVRPISFALETAEGPSVSRALPSAASADGGSLARLAGRSFGVRRASLCVFFDGDAGFAVAATTATAFSSALAACETPPARGKPSDALGGRVDAVGAGAAGGALAAAFVRGAAFARVAPAAVTAASPASADWLASPTVTLALRRGGAASPLADASSCWIGAVGPIRARRVSASEVACVAPAHAGKRTAPVRLSTDISAPSVFVAKPVVVDFTVSADGMDARGRPGGARAAAAADAARAAPAGNLGETRSGGIPMARFATPRVSHGSVPVSVRGARFPGGGFRFAGEPVAWCVFEDAASTRVYASRATFVSGATARCAPLAGSGFSGFFRSRATRDATLTVKIVAGFGVESSDAARLETRAWPEVRSATPRVVSASGGAEVALAGTAFLGRLPDEGAAERGDDARAAPRAGCRFGSVGPVAARHVSASVTACVSPAKAPSGPGGARLARFVPLGFALDPTTHLGETIWREPDGAGDAGAEDPSSPASVSAAVLVDGASQSGVPPVALAARGTVAGGASFDVFDVPLSIRADEETTRSSLRCVFGADAAASAASAASAAGGRGLSRAVCVSPPRLNSRGGVGFEALRVFAESRGAFVVGSGISGVSRADPPQFAFAPVPAATAVFPRRAWGPEVAHVSGAHLASRADGASGAGSVPGPFADNDACVFGGVAVPAQVVSSALVACETRAGAEEAPGRAAKTRSPARTKTARGNVSSRSLVGPSAVSAFGAGDDAHALASESVDSRRFEDSSLGGVFVASEARATTDVALWFVTVPAARPTQVDVEGGWSDGGTLARVTTSAVGDGVGGSGAFGSGWLDCAFGSTTVPGRPASASVSADGYEFGPLPGERASRSAERERRRAAESADLECVSPAHAPGTVPLELVPAKSKVPSAESAVFFSFA